MSSVASATRRRWPPERLPIGASQSKSREQPGDDVAHARIARPFVLGQVADDGRADGVVVVEGVGLVEHADA